MRGLPIMHSMLHQEAHPAGADAPVFALGFRSVVAGLAFAQTISWAILYYGFSSFVLAMMRDTVTLLEFADTLRADAVLQTKLYSPPNVTVIKSAQTTEVTGDGQKVNGIAFKDRATEEIRLIELEGIFVQIGLLPNTAWLKGTLNLSRFGEIEIDAKGQTSLPGVFAAGDCTTVAYKQIIIAMGAGATASLSAFDHLIRSPSTA